MILVIHILLLKERLLLQEQLVGVEKNRSLAPLMHLLLAAFQNKSKPKQTMLEFHRGTAKVLSII